MAASAQADDAAGSVRHTSLLTESPGPAAPSWAAQGHTSLITDLRTPGGSLPDPAMPNLAVAPPSEWETCPTGQ
jgi:hypothetical protein